MRTKTLLATVAATAITASAMAEVLSVNVVGFINKPCPNGYTLIANQLKGTNNNILTIVPVVPQGTGLSFWDTTQQQFDSYTYYDGVGWVSDSTGDPANEKQFPPGTGAFVVNPGAEITVTLVGEVPQNPDPMTSALVPGLSLVASFPPVAKPITDAVYSFPAQDGMGLSKWNVGAQEYGSWTYYASVPGWVSDASGDPETPSLEVAEGFFIVNPAVAPVTWTMTFTVAP